MNNWTGLGRLTRDPEIRYSQNQTAVCKFSLAIDDGYGEKKKTNFISIISFGKTAEACKKYLEKGSRCAVKGKIVSGSYEKEGRKVYTTDVVADRIDIIDFRAKDEPQSQFDVPEGFELVEDDDIPF